MSVWSDSTPDSASLGGTEGELVAVRISVDPRLLEVLLEALAEVSFPINPQIYHHAGIAYLYQDGRQEILRVTMVEFPAYRNRLGEVRSALNRGRFPADALHVQSMIEDLQEGEDSQPAPEGSAHRQVIFYKHLVEA